MMKGGRMLTVCAIFAVIGCMTVLVAAESVSPETPLKKPDLSKGAVLFTFDDCSVAEWVAVAPLFREYGAHATFFVAWPDRLKPEQIAGLKTLQNDGHAIGCHSLRHMKAVDMITAKGVDTYIGQDINPAKDLLRKAGFAPACFAYPSSQNNAESDAALLRIFRHLRTGTGLPEGKRLKDLDSIFVPAAEVEKRGCLTGTGIDAAGKGNRADYAQQVCEALDRAKARGEVVVFYAHCIAESAGGHHIQPAPLRAMLEHAKAIGLPAISYDELP